MAIAQGIRAGAAYVELYAHDNRLVRGLAKAQARLRAFSAAVQRIGMHLTRMSALAAVPMVLSTRTFAAFEDQMKAVQAVTGATGDTFDRLYEQAKRLGRTTSFTAAEVAAGMLNLSRAGFSPAEIEAAIAGMLDLARATGTDLAVAAEIASGTLRAFVLEADQMTRVADVMTATANNSAQTLEDLGESMKYAAPIAQEYGLSLEQTAKAIGVLANMQIKGTMAGTSLRQIMLRLSDPATQKGLHAIGVQALDAAGNLRPLGDLMLEIGGAMTSMTSAQRLALGRELFDQRAAGAALKLARSDFPQLQQAIDSAGGAAERTAKVMDSGIGGAFRRLMSAVEGVQIAIGEALADVLSRLMDRFAGVAIRITEIINRNRSLVVTVAKVIVIAAAAGTALVTLGLASKALAFVLGGLAAIIAGLGSVVGLAGSALATLLSPIGLVAAGVVGLAAGLLHATGAGAEAVTWLGERFSWLSRTASDAWRAIGQALTDGNICLAARVLWATLKLEWEQGTHALTERWVAFKNTFMQLASDAFYGAVSLLAEAWASMQVAWVETTSFLARTWSDFTAGLTEVWNITQNWLTKQWLKLWGLMNEGFDVQAALRMADEDLNRDLEAIERQAQTANQGIEQQRQQRRTGIEQERIGTLRAIDEMADTQDQSRRQRYAEQLQGSQAALDRAKADWQAAMAEASKVQQAPDADQPAGREQPDSVVDRIKRAMTEASGAVSRLSGGAFSTTGTFNALAAAGLGTGTAAERTAKATEETARNTGRIVRTIARGARFE